MPILHNSPMEESPRSSSTRACLTTQMLSCAQRAQFAAMNIQDRVAFHPTTRPQTFLVGAQRTLIPSFGLLGPFKSHR